MWMKITIPLSLLLLFVFSTEAQTRKVRLRQQRPVVQIENSDEDVSEEQPVIQYYRSQQKQDDARELVYVNEEEYQNLYAQQQPTPASRPRDYRPVITTVRPLSKASHSTLAPRTKVNEEKAPPVQTIRNYNKVNDDGSFTFGYEAADGSFKEETRGTDCVVRGKYGYIDPDGNKREFTYVSGNPCDPNNPDGEEEEERNSNRSEEQDENVPQNYPRRPVQAIARPRPTSAPTTPRAPTTVFQTRYNTGSEEEDDSRLNYAPIPKTTPRPQQPAFIQQTQRPRIQVIDTTPAPQQTVQPINYVSPTSSINITPKPLYKLQNNHLSSSQQSPQEPATTYRPHTVSIFNQKPAALATTASPFKGVTFSSGGSKGGAIDFDAEFKKFQQETGFQPITSAPTQSSKSPVKIHQGTTSNPIYQTQLVYNPSTGQYDSNLYQTIPQTDGDFQLNQRIQPYVQSQPQYQIQQQPQYYRPQPVAQPQQQAAVPQQIYQKQQNELQFLNSQQLFAQQLQMQQSQLQRDRIEAAKKNPSIPHRFQLQSAEQSPVLHRAPNGQQYYFIQPSSGGQSSGQIEAFLRGHNLEY